MFVGEYFSYEENEFKLYSLVEYDIEYKHKIRIRSKFFIEQTDDTESDVRKVLEYWNNESNDSYNYSLQRIVMNYDKDTMRKELNKSKRFTSMLIHTAPFDDKIKIINV